MKKMLIVPLTFVITVGISLTMRMDLKEAEAHQGMLASLLLLSATIPIILIRDIQESGLHALKKIPLVILSGIVGIATVLLYGKDILTVAGL